MILNLELLQLFDARHSQYRQWTQPHFHICGANTSVVFLNDTRAEGGIVDNLAQTWNQVTASVASDLPVCDDKG